MLFNSRARAIMVLGTSSHAGKSTVAAALCRSLSRRGLKVAPFKSQNMSNNSWVTPEGAEIGRAQAVQARAAGVAPHADMNPILLKPSGNGRMQVMALGKPMGLMDSREYYARIDEMRSIAHAAYDRLASAHEFVVLEGAGSPAEINLRDRDIANLDMAEHAGAACVLIADIERGGSFASIFGTLALLPPLARARLAGVVFNKFRGDASLLDPGIREIEARTGVPILGVLPWLSHVGLEEEDSLALPGAGGVSPLLDIAVLRFPHISNFTDFLPLERLEGASLRYVDSPLALGNPDLLILPGSKHTRADLAFLRGAGLDRSVLAAAARGIPVFGLCGGYQMLGESVSDPHGVEGDAGESRGLRLLPVRTELSEDKVIARARGENLALPFLPQGAPVEGYEIHMGRTTLAPGAAPAIRLRTGPGFQSDGCIAPALPVWGCYLHGLFESASVLEGLRDWIRNRKGLPVPAPAPPLSQDPCDPLADWLEAHAPSVPFVADPQRSQANAGTAKDIPGDQTEKE